MISAISLCDLGQHISSHFCTKKQTGLRVARGRQSPRDPWDVGATSRHRRVCECCGVGYCCSVFSEKSLNISTFPGSQKSRSSFCSALVKQSEMKCLKGVFRGVEVAEVSSSPEQCSGVGWCVYPSTGASFSQLHSVTPGLKPRFGEWNTPALNGTLKGR